MTEFRRIFRRTQTEHSEVSTLRVRTRSRVVLAAADFFNESRSKFEIERG